MGAPQKNGVLGMVLDEVRRKRLVRLRVKPKMVIAWQRRNHPSEEDHYQCQDDDEKASRKPTENKSPAARTQKVGSKEAKH
jgi:hypothetical protein